MIRKVALAVALAVGSLPFSAFGLGLGEINTGSALNQEFKADIRLYSVPKGELDGIKVSLATTEQFSRAGIDRFFFLTRLQFETIRQADGTAIIRVTSREPIREPYLDFLVNVIWAKGSMVKEYTVLLDPPTTTSRRPQAVQQTTSSRTAPRNASAPAARSAPRGMEPGTEQYGPVMANETMWQIADSLRPSGVTVHQMMMAMQDANPSAFIGNNINLLKEGVILRVPQREQLLSLDSKAATTNFTRQTKDWMSGTPTTAMTDSGTSGATVTPTVPVADSAKKSSARLEIATDEKSGAAGIGTDQGEEKAVAGKQLIAAREDAETARQNASVLEGEVGELERQVDDLQRLVVLKDKQLAQLQANVAAADMADGADMANGADAVDTADAVEAMPETDAAEMAPETDEVAEAETTDSVEMMPEEVAAIEESVVEQEPEVVEEAAVAPVQQPPSEELAWLDRNLPAVMGVGLAGLLGLGGLLAFMRRNKFKDEQWEQTKREMEESMLLADTQDVESVLSEIVDLDEDGSPADTSFLSEYSTEELRNLQEDTSEADPLSEADVYVAYGRYQQAQELLEAALVEQPGRAAIKHKMLEIFFATQDKKGFFSLAKEMMDAGQDKLDLPAWEQVVVMATDLDPANTLFGEGESVLGETIDLSELADDLDSTMQSDTQAPESMGLDSIEIASSRLSPDTQAAEDAVELVSTKVGRDDTELHTELRDASVLTEFADDETESLDDELAELEGDLEDLMADPNEAEGSSDEDQLAAELDDISGGAGDSIIAGESGDDTETLGISEFTEPTTEIEVETKLELAQAYIDMGDRDGAQEIIQEILVEGTEAQVSKAKDLKSSLDT